MLQTTTKWLGRNEKGNFMAVHIDEEAYGEVDPEFYREFQHELGPVWTLFDNTVRRLQVAFNMSENEPRMTDDWMNIRTSFKLNGDHIVYLSYFGDNIFMIKVIRDNTLPHTFPSYHSKSTKGRLISFDITLSDNNTTGSQLTIKNEFANFVANLGFQSLYLCGAYTEKASTIFIIDYGRKMVKLGDDWNDFYEQNRFQLGDNLRFQFINVAINIVVGVTKF